MTSTEERHHLRGRPRNFTCNIPTAFPETNARGRKGMAYDGETNPLAKSYFLVIYSIRARESLDSGY